MDHELEAQIKYWTGRLTLTGKLYIRHNPKTNHYTVWELSTLPFGEKVWYFCCHIDSENCAREIVNAGYAAFWEETNVEGSSSVFREVVRHWYQAGLYQRDERYLGQTDEEGKRKVSRAR